MLYTTAYSQAPHVSARGPALPFVARFACRPPGSPSWSLPQHPRPRDAIRAAQAGLAGAGSMVTVSTGLGAQPPDLNTSRSLVN